MKWLIEGGVTILSDTFIVRDSSYDGKHYWPLKGRKLFVGGIILCICGNLYFHCIGNLRSSCNFVSNLIIPQIYCHLKNYAVRSEQRYIVRVILLIPTYAIYSFASTINLVVRWPVNLVYIQPIHTLAEGIYYLI